MTCLSSEIKIVHVALSLNYAWLYVGRPQLSPGMGAGVEATLKYK